ncbi:iron uptake system protein EfeO [Streptomyces sp. 8L]|uniref:iron uptake system protein EfeO n=1 Tax=Streptomyces sp. 8L TaxID=2877242 RepID=UPI001CD2DF17|nr:iron uptake system protein EfeO [Streptomyces sp. 8L]MCA1219867.1 EfeM/EfeO family lipoprotein [Streptomyces sp. 8L]
MLTTDRHLRAVRRRSAMGAVGALTALTLVSCSSGNSGSAAASGPSGKATTGASAGASAVNVTLKSGGSGDVCETDATTAKAGPVTFTVKNESATGIIEFELLQQQRIVGEKENLAPGLAPVSFTATLGGGKYQLYCPGAAKELTDFTVTGKPARAANGSTATLLADGAKGYDTYVTARLNDLLNGAKALQTSIDAGNLKQAKSDYAGTRQFYEKVESDVAGFVKPGFQPTDNAGNLDYLVDMRASNLDPSVGWHGFHAIERDLWKGGTITPSTKKLAAELVTNITTLKKLAPTLQFKPEDLANGAAGLLEEVQSNKITGEEEAFSHIDLADLAANVEGARQAFAYLQPGLKKIDPTVTTTIQKRFTDVDTVMGKLRDSSALGGYVPWDATTKAAHAKEISQSVQALQDPLSQLAQKVATAK